MKKIIRTIIITVILSLTFGSSAMAYSRCGYKGCENNTENCHNGTVFCDTHARAYAREKGYSTCPVSGCYDRPSSGHTYCFRHSCSASGCSNKATSDRLCSTHKCKYPGCSSMRYYTSGKYSGYCNNHAYQVSGVSSSKKSTSSYKSSSSSKKSTSSYKKSSSSSKKSTTSKKYEMPDCDDYEDYDDFMDEWDGCMPDGSDAEDYWENW